MIEVTGKTSVARWRVGWNGPRNSWSVYLFPTRENVEFGLSESYYDGPLYAFGLGRLALICWMEIRR